MRIVSGIVKANKEDIEAMKTFLFHAQIDMDFGGDGSYVKHGTAGNTNDTDMRELKKGKYGKECIELLLEGLCDKWR